MGGVKFETASTGSRFILLAGKLVWLLLFDLIDTDIEKLFLYGFYSYNLFEDFLMFILSFGEKLLILILERDFSVCL